MTVCFGLIIGAPITSLFLVIRNLYASMIIKNNYYILYIITYLTLVGAIMIIGQSMLWMFTAPQSTLVMNQMPAFIRSRAIGFQMMISHLFGTNQTTIIFIFLAK